MNAYKLEVLVIDFDHIGEQGVKDAICNARYPNHCISPSVEAIQSADIGVWSDDHPLNNSKTCEAEYRRLFERTTSPVMDAPDTSQDWAKLDGATAFHLIERHAEDWAETGRMMESWLAARMAAAAPHAPQTVAEGELPPLPEPKLLHWDGIHGYEDDDMHTYARAAIAASQQAEQPDTVERDASHLAAIEEALKVMRENGLDECYAYEEAKAALVAMKEKP